MSSETLKKKGTATLCLNRCHAMRKLKAIKNSGDEEYKDYLKLMIADYESEIASRVIKR